MNKIIENSINKPISIPLLKAHLRIEHDHEDEYLESIIDIATEILEQNINKSILNKKYKYTTHEYNLAIIKKIEIPIDPVLEIVSVNKIINDSNTEETQFFIERKDSKTFVCLNDLGYPLEIVYRAGITDIPDEIPKDITYAILQIAKNIYDCSDQSILESQYIRHVINAYRKISIN